MGKSIRSKTKKESRTQLRNTIGAQAAQTALESTQAKLKECVSSKTTSIDRLANLFSNDEGEKLMIIDSSTETKEKRPTKEVEEEEIYADTTRVPGKKYEKMIKRKYGVVNEKKAKQLVNKIVRRRRMQKPGSMLRF